MSALLRLASVLLLLTGGVVEAGGVLPANGVALVLAACLAGYLWFLSVARRTSEPPQRRRL